MSFARRVLLQISGVHRLLGSLRVISIMVSSPKSSAKKKGSAAKSAAKSVSNRSAFRYGSKMAQMCADNVIARHVNGATNPALATKWLNKMKLSILRKVSACSKVAFLSDGKCPQRSGHFYTFSVLHVLSLVFVSPP